MKTKLPKKSPFDFTDRGLLYNRLEVPAKVYHNSVSDMALLNLYTKGPLKFEDTGKVCRECANFYYDDKARYGGRCKARGFMQTHPDTPADDRPKGWTHPIDQTHFRFWPGCPLFVKKERLSRR